MNAHIRIPSSTVRLRLGACMAAATLSVLASGGMLLSAAGTTPAQLLRVAAQDRTVLIDATDPVAYSVSRPDPRTLVLDLRGTRVGNATSHVQPDGPVAAVRVEQTAAADGLPVARVRLSLAAAAGYTVRSNRNTIRVELVPSPAEPPAVALPARGATGTALRAPAPAASGTPSRAAAPDVHGIEAIAALETVGPARAAGRSDAASPGAREGQAAAADAGAPPQAGAPPAAPEPEPPPMSPVLEGPQSGQLAGTQDRKYSGHPVSMDFQGVDLRSVLRTFAEISGLNMVIDPDVQGTVDIVLTDVPWDQALEVILRGNGLDYTVDGTIVRIARIATLKKEQDERTQLAQSAANAGALAVRTYTLSYARAKDTEALLKKAVLSSRGNAQIDERTNTLIITDLPARLETVSQLLATLDRPEPQVEIEARIITTTREFARALGVEWGLSGRVNSEVGNTTSLAFPNNGALTAGQNLRVPSASSVLGLALGSINGAFNLDVALSALERSGKGRILSTPRVTTQNNVEAEITQGVQIPVQTEANNTVTVTFKDAALTLKVTPQITAANTVIMQITLENATPGVLVGAIPSIDTQRAITRVQVSDGMTTVMGGIFVSREQSSNDRTPALHRIPLLGWLFKRDSQLDESRELLIFITPRIQKG